MRIFGQYIILILVFVLSVCFLSDVHVYANNEIPLTYGDFEYEIKEDGTVSISKYKDEYDKNVEIPSHIDGKTVTEIGYYSFYGCENIETVTFPETILKIGDRAFFDCGNLTTIHFPKSLEVIDRCAFARCVNLKSIELPDTVTTILSGAFEECISIKSVKIPKSTTVVTGFDRCTSLEKVEFHDGVKEIDNLAFYGCTKLSDITIPSSVEKIGFRAFDNTAYYNSADNWKGNALYLAGWLISVKNEYTKFFEVAPGTKGIADNMFEEFSHLREIEISEGVEFIGDNVFYGCDDLQFVILPESLKKLGEHAFDCCNELASVHIPDSITVIESGLFMNCTSLVDIVLSPMTKTIGSIAFYGCTALEKLEIPGIVYEIKNDAFGRCESLKEVVLPEGITAIERGSFSNCKSLETVEIPGSVTEIAMCAFEYCDSLKNIYYHGTKDEWDNIQIDSLRNDALYSAEIHYNYVAEAICNTNEDFLLSLNVIDEKMLSKQYISRSDAAKIAGRLIYGSQLEIYSNSVIISAFADDQEFELSAEFDDMDESRDDYKLISNLYCHGGNSERFCCRYVKVPYITGYNGKMRPDDIITWSEFVTLMMRVTNWDVYIYLENQYKPKEERIMYPDDYFKIAERIGLESFKRDGLVSVTEACDFIYDIVQIPTIQYQGGFSLPENIPYGLSDKMWYMHSLIRSECISIHTESELAEIVTRFPELSDSVEIGDCLVIFYTKEKGEDGIYTNNIIACRKNDYFEFEGTENGIAKQLISPYIIE